MTYPVTSDMTEPMLQLYSFELCPFAHRVRLALAEKGVAAEPIEIDLKNKPASFVRISPYGRVPLLLHGEVKLWESAVINEYLDEVFPDPPLMPASLPDRALARIWVKFALWRPNGASRFASREAWGNRIASRSQFLDRDSRAHHVQEKIRQMLCEA